MGDPGLIPGSGNPLEKGMATHSCILAWRIPQREEPGRLQSMGSQSWTRLSDAAIFKVDNQQGPNMGNSAQCYVAAWMGGEFGGQWIHVHV